MMRREILAIVTVALLGANSFGGTYSGGTGEPNDPYRIATAEDLNDIGNHPNDWDRHFIVVSDIDMSRLADAGFSIIGRYGGQDDPNNRPFGGSFDGDGHKIINLTIDTGQAGAVYLGLFGKVAAGGEVKDLGLENVTVAGGYESAGLGGLAGFNQGSISNCYSTGAVSGDDCLGGLVGYNQGGIRNCYSTALVIGGNSSADLGGLVGVNYDVGGISNCYSGGSVSGDERVGGLVGWNEVGNINNCYSTAAVSGEDCLGGLVGYNDGSISDCYSTGSVTGGDSSEAVGGLVGANYGAGGISNCFWDVATSGQDAGDGGAGKGTAQMKRQSTFTEAGWDFVQVWNIGENQTYPFLRVHPAGDINHDDRVNFLDLAVLASHWLEGH